MNPTLVWRVDDFPDLVRSSKYEDMIKSKHFVFGSHKWHLELYPCGYTSEGMVQISLDPEKLPWMLEEDSGNVGGLQFHAQLDVANGKFTYTMDQRSYDWGCFFGENNTIGPINTVTGWAVAESSGTLVIRLTLLPGHGVWNELKL